MTAHLNAAVWIDHKEARVFHVDGDSFDEKSIQSPGGHLHRHAKDSSEKHQHPDDQKRFFDEVAHLLADSVSVLIVGPSTAKLQFVKYAHQHVPALVAKIVGLETIDHPTDAQLVAYVKTYFHVPAERGR
jgi:stalled ribosome rescue protein Dom34